VWHAPDYKSDVFFDGKITKMTSVLAALATAAFINAILNSEDIEFRKYAKNMPHFDARVWSVPSQTEAANAILWRTIDCFKNSVSMVAHHYFSHKSLQNMNQAQMQERMFQEKGINFGEDMPEWFKNGTFVKRVTVQKSLTKEELEKIPETVRPPADTKFIRTVVTPIDMPIFSKVINRVGVIFNNEDPETE
jgi:tRNA(His) 5'-end guanylyltransferase